MPYDFLLGNKRSILSPDPVKKQSLYTEVNRNKLTIDPKALFLHEPPGYSSKIEVPFYTDPYVDFEYVHTVEGYVMFDPDN
jgi:hypothetical protein